MVDIPMPRANPIDEEYRELRAALDDARRDVIEAQQRHYPSVEILELRHRAYRAWQRLEKYLRDHEVIFDEKSSTSE
jgi:hypothetical protein